jgi:hypothetical protein
MPATEPRHAAFLDWDDPDRLTETARELIREHRPAEALANLDRVIAAAPDHATAHFLRGEALFLLRRIEPALTEYRAALYLGLESDYDAFEAAMSGAIPGDFGWLSAMLLGEFEEAWQIADRTLHRRRAAGRDLSHLPRHLRPVWDGAPLSGKSVLVRCYHGLGDTIQFARYLPLLKPLAAHVTVQAQPALLPLLAALPGVDRFVPLDDSADPPHEVAVEISDLPHVFRTALATIPTAVPYLAVPDAERAAERRRLAGIPGFKIGVAWVGGGWKPERFAPVSSFEPLTAIPGVALLNLQRGPARQALAQPGAPVMWDGERDSLDIMATAATIANLDLVICVDTMVAHLAGALGVPVWLLLHHASDWRWLLETDRSPWYPAMRLFRQAQPGDWRSVMATVQAALHGHLRH